MTRPPDYEREEEEIISHKFLSASKQHISTAGYAIEGMSGSPLITLGGHLVGVLSGYYSFEDIPLNSLSERKFEYKSLIDMDVLLPSENKKSKYSCVNTRMWNEVAAYNDGLVR